MRIVLVANFALDRQESMLRFANQLAEGLRGLNHEVSTWSPQPCLVRLLPNYRYRGVAKFIGYFDKYVAFPRQLRRRLAEERAPDLVHIIDHANAVYAPIFESLPLIATCHDLLQIRAARGEFPEHRISSAGRRYQRWILKNIALLSHVAVPSLQTGADLRRLAGLAPERITLIPNGLNFPYRPTAPAIARLAVGCLLRERQLSPGLLEHGGRGFILNVGGGQWYKNRHGLLEIYAALRTRLNPSPRLVLVGKPLSPGVAAHAERLGITPDMIMLSHVTEPQLQALYSLADGLLFPSWHEGFGWPVAEAHACGCPVFTSNRPPMTEIGGEAAVYLPPDDPRAAAEQMVAAWPRRPELAQCGLARAANWAPALMIERYLATYAQVAAAFQPVLA